MSLETSKNTRPGTNGFTLLEVMLAVMVLGMVVISIYRFVETTLVGVRMADEEFRNQALTASFGTFLRTQMDGIPMRLGALTGEPHIFNDIPSDELQWIASPGFGMMTRHARGEYRVTLTVQEPEGGGPLELGLRRQDIDGREESTWFPLIKDAKGLEVRYFDPRSNEWVEKWTDLVTRPSLVRVKFWREGSPEPYESVLLVPYAASSVLMPTLNFGGGRGNRGGRGGRNPRREQPQPGSPDNPQSSNPPPSRQRPGRNMPQPQQ